MNDLLSKSYTAGATVYPYRILKFSADNTVVLGAAASDALVGIYTAPMTKVVGDSVDVMLFGIADLKLGGAVTRGTRVTADATGQGVAASTSNYSVGIALLSGVSGDIVPIVVNPIGPTVGYQTFVAEVTLTAAQIKALNATPITLVAAPGANKALVLASVSLFLDYESAGYAGIAGGEDLAIKYTDANGIVLATVETTGFLDGTADAVRHVYPTTTAAFVPAANAALVAHMLTGEITTGDSPLKVRVNYTIIDTAW